MSAQFAPPLAVVLSFHGVVERVEHPEIQVNHIELESFERILSRVRTEYEVVTLDDVAGAVRGQQSIPAKAAALTFDDAYRSVLEVVDPVLARLGLPYAVFVPSGLVESGGRVPTYVLRAALAFTEESSVRLPGRRRAFKLRTADERERAAGHAAELLRSLPRDQAEGVLEQLRALVPDRRWDEIDATFASEALLDWDELRALAARGVIVGSHTRDHAVLHERQGAQEIAVQVAASKRAIEEQLSTPCRHFCYPHGHPRDLCRASIEATREADYSSAFMNVGGPVREAMDPLLLPRISIAGSPPDAALAARVQLSHTKWYAEIAKELGRG